MAITLGNVAAIALGGVLVGYLYSESKDAQRAVRRGKKALKEATDDTGLRLPRPDFAVHLPNSEEDYDTLDEVVCMCALQVKNQQPEVADDFNAFILAVRDCVAAALYPDFEWPPAPGDHPTVEKFWTILTYEVSRSAIEETLCVTETPEVDEGATEGNPIQFIPPPAY